MISDASSTEVPGKDNIEVLITNLKNPYRKRVFSAIDEILGNKITGPIEPLKQLLMTSEKTKVRAYAGLALKELNYHITEDENKILYESIIKLINNQDIHTRLFAAELLLKCYSKNSSSDSLTLVKVGMSIWWLNLFLNISETFLMRKSLSSKKWLPYLKSFRMS